MATSADVRATPIAAPANRTERNFIDLLPASASFADLREEAPVMEPPCRRTDFRNADTGSTRPGRFRAIIAGMTQRTPLQFGPFGEAACTFVCGAMYDAAQL